MLGASPRYACNFSGRKLVAAYD